MLIYALLKDERFFSAFVIDCLEWVCYVDRVRRSLDDWNSGSMGGGLLGRNLGGDYGGE
jgi:hypothetical protein